MVDFSALRRRDERTRPVHPREIHRLLPRKALGYFNLWDAQAQVLNQFNERGEERDLIIKLNTGGGKTIVGLLILQSHLNAGNGPALYVAPDKFLSKQVRADAERLGIATTDDVESAAYRTGAAIGVINAWKLVSGRSVFSDRRPSGKVPIGAVVVDDAHAALATTRSNLSLSIQRDNPAWGQLLDLFTDDLKSAAPDPYADIRDDRPGSPVRVPFWAWRSNLDQVRSILRAQAETDEQPLYWSWRAVADILHLCRAVFSNRQLTITAPCPPVNEVTSFAQASHRVFLSATLADDSVLVTDFDADADSIARAIAPSLAGDIGERMILAPQEINPDIPTSAIREQIVELSRTYNTVVLVPSNKWAETWSGDAAIVAAADGIEAAVARLTGKDPKTGEPSHVGLVVLVGKYDGVDLPQDACRILVIDGLPEAFTPEERLHTALHGDERGIDDRQVQRLEQGMGRGIRSGEDHCVVVLLGPRLSHLTVDPNTRGRFSPATRAQLDLSREVAAQVDGAPLNAIVETMLQALRRDEDWVDFAKEGLTDLPAQVQPARPSATAQRRAFDSAALFNDLAGAVSILTDAAEAESSEREAGALLEQAATYADHFDPERGQQLLDQARRKNPFVLRPLAGVQFVAVTADDSQAAIAHRNLISSYGTPAQLRLDVASLVDELRFDPDRAAERFEDALWQLGRLIGVGSQRPEHTFGVGPDNLWALDENTYWVIEAKSGATSRGIGKRDMGQLGQSMTWFGRQYPASATSVPVMVHPSRAVYKDASPLPGLRIIDAVRLGELCAALTSFGEGLAATGWKNVADVDRLLAGHKLRSGDLSSYTRAQHGVV